jgi:hypothetical protein
MLVIRARQMVALQRNLEDRFRERIADGLRQSYGDAIVVRAGKESQLRNLSHQDLRDLIEIAIMRAQMHGLVWESSLWTFTLLAFLVAPDFDNRPEVARFLDVRDLAVDYSFAEMVERLSEEDWARIRSASNLEAWDWALVPRVPE